MNTYVVIGTATACYSVRIKAKSKKHAVELADVSNDWKYEEYGTGGIEIDERLTTLIKGVNNGSKNIRR